MARSKKWRPIRRATVRAIFPVTLCGTFSANLPLAPDTRGSTHLTTTIMNEETNPAAQLPENRIPIDTTNLRTIYANVVAITANINEFYLAFGLNTDPYNAATVEPVKLDTRVIMTPDAAKRLCLNLNKTIAAFEQRFGVIELDLQKRIHG